MRNFEGINVASSKYSKKIFNTWVNFLKERGYDFVAAKRTGNIYFTEYLFAAEQETIYRVKVDEQNYCMYAKLPLIVTKEKIDEVSSYIFMANGNPMFAHFTLNYDTGEVFCVHGAFCEGDAPDAETIWISMSDIESFILSFYKGLVNAAETNMSPEEAYETNF